MKHVSYLEDEAVKSVSGGDYKTLKNGNCVNIPDAAATSGRGQEVAYAHRSDKSKQNVVFIDTGACPT